MQQREKYPNDLTASFNDEIVHLKNVHKVTFESTAESQEGPIDLLNKIFTTKESRQWVVKISSELEITLIVCDVAS